MPKLQRLLVDEGASFTNSIASFPLCCPSRATWMTGEYAHNHGVHRQPGAQRRRATSRCASPIGCCPRGYDAAGYDTALVGKCLHDYRTLDPAPGWDRFWAMTAPTMVDYYGYDVTDSRGGKVHYGEDAGDYLTDALTRDYALPFIRSRARNPRPFFLHVSYIAPHWGRGRNDAAGRRCANGKPFSFDTAKAKPAPRDAGAFAKRSLPEPPSFNEDDMSDKPGAVRGRRSLQPRQAARPDRALPLRARQPARRRPRASGRSTPRSQRRPPGRDHLRHLHLRQRLHARRAPDPRREGAALRGGAAGAAGHPRPGDSRRSGGSTRRSPTSTSLRRSSSSPRPAPPRPTLARPIDGRSLAPYTYGRGDPDRAILIESKRPPRRTAAGTFERPVMGRCANARYTYVEHYRAEASTLEAGFGLPIGEGQLSDTELYDLATDPRELESHHADPAYAAPRAALAGRARAAARLLGCRLQAATSPCRRLAELLKTRRRGADTGVDVRHRCSAAHGGRERGLRPSPEGSVPADDPCPRRAEPDRGRPAA